MTLSDIPKYVPLKVGDTVVTDGKSSIFFFFFKVSKTAGFVVVSRIGFWVFSVELSEKIGKLSKVYVVRNLKKSEVQKIDDSLKVQITKDGQ